MTAPAARIKAFDWLRGLAVLFMIQCHALSLLTPERRAGQVAQLLIWLDGLVAPSFIFSAGFSLALVQVRGAASGNRLKRVRKTSRRLLEVLFVACLVNLMWFNYPIIHLHELKWFLRVDILHCIALALFLALPLMVLLAPRPRVLRWVALVLAVVTFALSPLRDHVQGLWALLANEQHALDKNTGAVFPLLPWAGYVYLGASAGASAALGDLRELFFWVVGVTALGLVAWLVPGMPYLLHNHGNRIWVMGGLVLILLGLEYRAPGAWEKSPPVRFVEVFGASSLAGYFFHEMLLYYEWFGFSFHRVWGDSCGYPKYAWLTALLIASTFALVLLMNRVYAQYDGWLKGNSPFSRRAAQTG